MISVWLFTLSQSIWSSPEYPSDTKRIGTRSNKTDASWPNPQVLSSRISPILAPNLRMENNRMHPHINDTDNHKIYHLSKIIVGECMRSPTAKKWERAKSSKHCIVTKMTREMKTPGRKIAWTRRGDRWSFWHKQAKAPRHSLPAVLKNESQNSLLLENIWMARTIKLPRSMISEVIVMIPGLK